MCFSYCVDSFCRCYISYLCIFGFQIIIQVTNLRFNNGFKKKFYDKYVYSILYLNLKMYEIVISFQNYKMYRVEIKILKSVQSEVIGTCNCTEVYSVSRKF